MPPNFPVLLSVIAGILLAGRLRFAAWLWWSLAGLSVLASRAKPLRAAWLFLFAACIAALRCALAPPPAALPVRAAQAQAGQSQSALERWLHRSLPPPCDAVALGIILGEHGGVPPGILDDFKATGAYHVLVASGLKVGIVAAMAWLLLAPLPFHVRLAGSAAAVLGYALLAGNGDAAPLVRASLMALIALAALAYGRGEDGLSALTFAGIGILLANPLDLFEPGFQLTFLSVLGIFAFHEKFTGQLSSFMPRWIASSIAVTFAAMLPIVIPLAYYFHSVSFVSPLANLIAVPLTVASIAAGAASFALQTIWKPAGYSIAFWHVIILKAMLAAVNICARLPFACVWVKPPRPLTIALFYAALAGLKLTMHNRRDGKIILACSATCLAAITLVNALSPKPAILTFLNVGQGDCAVITMQSKTFLIDGGGSPTEIAPGGYSVGEKIVVPFLESQGINSIDGILLTHPHLDHAGGLIAVLNRFPVKRIWLPDLTAKTPVYRTFLQTAKSKHVPLIVVHGGEKIALTRAAALRLFWPVRPFIRGSVSDLNNNSVVSRLDIGGLKILFAGDVEREAEARTLGLAHPRSELWSQILKAPHHGSGTSSTPGFLEAIKPAIAIVSVGKHNPYHLPSPAALNRLRRTGAKVYRTDKDGTIRFEIESTGLRPRIEPVAQSIPH